jgi:DHA2 family multidrug resistance protein-like MFS transporter
VTAHPELPTQARWGAAACIGACTMLTVLAMSLPAIGLPTIAANLHIDAGASIGIVLACQVALAAVLLPLAAVGDWMGHRRLCVIGLWIVLAGSIASALSESFTTLMLARVIQGVGCAAIFAVTSALVRMSYPAEQLGRGLANNSMVVSVSTAITPPIAGLLVVAGSWHALFLVPAAFAVVTLLIGVRALPHSQGGDRPPDLPGVSLIALTFGPLVLGISLLSQPGFLVAGLAALGIGLACAVVLLRHQHGLDQPLLPLDLLRIPAVGLSVAASFTSFSAQQVAMIALPFTLQGAMHFSTGTAGALLSIWPAALLLITPVAGRLADRHAAAGLGAFGMVTMGIGLAICAASGGNVPWLLGTGLALSGCGVGIFQLPNNRLIVGSAPLNRRGMVGGLMATTRVTGHSVGAAGAAFLLHFPARPLLPLAVASVLALLAAGLSAARFRQNQETDRHRRTQ